MMAVSSSVPRFRVGLTGGIGSGKTTVAGLFGAHGVSVIDTDQIAHNLTGPGGAAIGQLRIRFGEDFLLPTGALYREKMRNLVFADPLARSSLESILHPLILSETENAAAQAHGSYIILVVPLLVESGDWKRRVSRVLVVDCPESLQIQRVCRRSNLSVEQVKSIMSTQAARTIRLSAADDIIINETDSFASLDEQVCKLHLLYTRLARAGKT